MRGGEREPPSSLRPGARSGERRSVPGGRSWRPGFSSGSPVRGRKKNAKSSPAEIRAPAFRSVSESRGLSGVESVVWRSVLGPVLRKTRFQVSLSGGKKTLSPHRQNSILGDTTISESRWPCGGLRAAAFRKTKNLRTGHFRQWGGVAGITIGGGSRKGSTSYSGRGEAGVALRRWSEGPARATEECESRTAGLEARCSAKGQSGNAVRRAGSVQSMKTLKAVATRDQGQSMQGPQQGARM